MTDHMKWVRWSLVSLSKERYLEEDRYFRAGEALRSAVVTWDKTEACRPHQGMFRNQSEFILIATRGSIGKEQDRPRVFPAGVFRHYLKPSDKMHLTGKPVPLMRHLMTVLPPGSRVLDPFMGSGTTLVAARDLGHVAHGIDLSPDNVRIAADRLGVPVP